MIGEIIFSLIILLGSIYLFYDTTQFRDIAAYKNVGSAFWPQIVLVIIIILIGYVLIKNLLTYVRKHKNAPFVTGNFSSEFMTGSLRLLGGMGFIIAYVIFLKPLGFMFASPLFIIGLMLFMNPKRKILMLYGSVGIMAVIYVLFVKLLVIPVPRGTGIFYDLSLLLGC